MTDTNDQKYLLQQNPWYQASAGSAIVSGVFAGIVLTLLLIQTYHIRWTDPKQTDKLAALRKSYQSGPADEILAEEIRQKDTRQRRAQYARLQFVHRGSVLFVFWLAAFVGSLTWMRSFRQKLPHPVRQTDLSIRQIQFADRSRLAVAMALTLLGGGGLFVALRPGQPPTSGAAEQEFATGQAEDRPVFASWEQMKQNWPVFRGPEGSGVCPFEKIPTQWDGPSGQNIRWKTAVPLSGHNSPIVWDKRVFLTGASEKKQQIFCFDADNGSLLWNGDVPVSTDPQRKEMSILEETGYAASTAATNGAYVAAIFADGQVGCFDLTGKRQWVCSLGVPASAYGYAASLTVYEDRLIIQMDQDYEPGASKLIALDITSGKTLWQTERPVPNSWSSPTVVQLNGRAQILASGSPWVIGYDPADGKELWRVECLGGDVAPTQVVSQGKVFAVEPYTHLVAIDPAAPSEEGTPGRLLWAAEGSIPDISSPIVSEQLVWTLDTGGTLGCYDIRDGSKVYAQDLDAMFQASGSLVDQILYLQSTKGKMILLKAGSVFEKVAENELGEEIFASAAFAPGRIYLRGTHHLYCIETKL